MANTLKNNAFRFLTVLALTFPTCGSRSIGIVSLRTKATEFSFSLDSVAFRGRNRQLGHLRYGDIGNTRRGIESLCYGAHSLHLILPPKRLVHFTRSY
jgi:hypothetical protein